MIPWYLSRYIVESLETDLKIGFLFTPHCYDTFYSAGKKNFGRYLLDFPERASTVLLIINLILVLQPIFCGMIITLISGIRPMNKADEWDRLSCFISFLNEYDYEVCTLLHQGPTRYGFADERV